MYSKKIKRIEPVNLPNKEERFRLLQDRRRLLQLIREIEKREHVYELHKNIIEERKSQFKKGEMTEQDREGNFRTQLEIESNIKVDEDSLKDAEMQIFFLKEDLFYLLNGQLTGYKDEEINLEKAKQIVNEHYQMINKEYKKIKEVFQCYLTLNL